MSDLDDLRSLVNQYAHAVDHWNAQAYADLFLPDGRIVVYEGSEASASIREIVGREALAQLVDRLPPLYVATLHFVGNTMHEVDGDSATGEVYKIAHHLSDDERGRLDQVFYLRYLDTYRRTEAGWRFAERKIVRQWSETRPADPTSPA
jgi:hypothetical protein